MASRGWLHALTCLVLFTGSLSLVLGSIATPHHCSRSCVQGFNRVCEYNFTVENYFVLSKACYLCPFVEADCFRPHCVSTNGMLREIMTVNRQLPGPTIDVCEGDIIRVRVENKMEDGSSTSIHWHGIHQRNTVYMDGVPMLTQCSIAPYETFQYDFEATNAGTHWYHSHTGLQLGDGVIGAFIVRKPDASEPHKLLYDEDKTDHVIMVSDWVDTTATFRYFEEMHDIWKWPVTGLATLVNGRGARHAVTDPHNITGYAEAPVPTQTPRETFTVTQNRRYRFRVISATTRCFHRFMVDDHQLTMIASDGEPFVPVTVGSFILHPGERYDFVLTADQPVGNYWMKMQGLGNCAGTDGHGYAILRYSGSNVTEAPAGSMTDFAQEARILNPDPTIQMTNDKTYVEDLRYETSIDENYTDEEVHHKYYISLRYQANDNTIYAHPVYYPNPSRKGVITPTLNNITMWRPPIPLTSQWEDFDEANVCNSHSINTEEDCNDNLCQCFHMLPVGLGEVVELFLFSQAADPHSMHLHGYSFRVVGAGMWPRADEDMMDATLADIQRRDEAGDYPRNLINPAHKDTLNINGRGGYGIIRFKADNPGLWFFHCHNEGHLMQGMAMVIKVGYNYQLPPVPNNFPTCGGYTYQRNRTSVCTSAGNPSMTSFSLPATLLSILFSLLCY